MDPTIAPIAENGSLQQILELLKKGSYISQIIRTTSLPKHFVNKIVKWLKDKKVIIPIPGKPIFYKYDPKSAIDILPSKTPPKTKGKEELIKTMDHKVRIHNVKFITKNTQTAWSHRLLSVMDHRSAIIPFNDKNMRIDIYRRFLDKTVYFDIQPALPMFNGITTIRIFRTNIMFYFNRKIMDQKSEFVDPDLKKIDEYVDFRRKDCEVARDWLQGYLRENIGVNPVTPVLNRKTGKPIFHYEIWNSDLINKGPLHNLRFQLVNGAEAWDDDSLGTGDGNPEVNDAKTAAVLGQKMNAQIKLDEVENKVNDLPKQISESISKSLNEFKVRFSKELTEQMSKAVGDAVSSALTNVFTTFQNNNQNQPPPGGVFI